MSRHWLLHHGILSELSGAEHGPSSTGPRRRERKSRAHGGQRRMTRQMPIGQAFGSRPSWATSGMRASGRHATQETSAGILGEQWAGDRSRQWLRPLLNVLIMGVAAFLRLYHIDTWQHFFGDEGREMFAAADIFRLHAFPLLGPPLAVGNMSLGPIFYYIIAIPVWLAHYQPWGGAATVALFGIATVWLLYRLCADILGSPKAGVIASALYATSQVVVYHARYVWNPNLAPFFVTLVLYSLAALCQGRQRWLPALGLSLSISLQLQPVLIISLPAVALVWLIYRPPVTSPSLVFWAIVLFILAETPLVIFEMTHQFQNTKDWIDFFRAAVLGHKTGVVSNVPVPSRSLTHRLLHSGSSLLIFYRRITGLEHLRYAVPLLVASSVGVLWCTWRSPWRTGSQVLAIILIVWTAIYFLGFAVYPGNLYEQYFVALFPVPFLAAGMAGAVLWRWLWMGRFLVCAAVALIAIANVRGLTTNTFALQAYQADHFFAYSDLDTRMMIADEQPVVDAIVRATQGHSFNLVVVSTDDSGLDYRYLLSLHGLTPSKTLPTPPSVTSKDPAIVYPGSAQRFFLIVQPKTLPESQWPSWLLHPNLENNRILPAQEFSFALLRETIQEWAPEDVSPIFNKSPSDES